MRGIDKGVLAQKINESRFQYVSRLMFVYWLSVYGQNVEDYIDDDFDYDEEEQDEGDDNTE